MMTVNPGFGGQEFIPHQLDKIAEAREIIDKYAPKVRLAVDGGIGIDNIEAVADAGADMFIAGSAIFHSKDYAKTIAAMRSKLAK